MEREVEGISEGVYYTQYVVTPAALTQAQPGSLKVGEEGHSKSFSHLPGVSQHAEGAHRSRDWQGVSHSRRVSVALEVSPGSLLQGVCDLFPHSRKQDFNRTS